MTITATEIAAINENLRGIRDYSEKLEAMHDFQKKFFGGGANSSKVISSNITAVKTSINKQSGSVISVLKGIGKTISSMSNSADKLNDTLSKIFDSVKSGGIAISPTSKAEISAVSSLTAPMAQQPVVAERQSAIVESITPLDVGGPEIVKAIEKNGEIQEETNSLFRNFIKLEKDQIQKEATNKLVNNDRPIPGESKKEIPTKLAMPKFPLSGKQFLGELGKILKDLLNPVALIATFVSKFLPYVILAVAFFKGFWKGIGEKLREQLSLWAKRIGLGVAIIFGLFKGIPLLIRTLQLAFYTLKVGYVLAKWALEVTLYMLKLSHENTAFAKDMLLIMKKIGHALITFALEIKSIIFGNALKLAEFIFTISRWVIIIGLVFLLVAGVILIFNKFGDKILDATKKIIDVFMEVAKMAASMVLLLPNMFIDMILRLFKGIFGTEELKPSNNKTEAAANTVAEKYEQAKSFAKEMKDAFDAAIKPILTPLTEIKDSIKDIVNSASDSSGITTNTVQVIRTFASSVVEEMARVDMPMTMNADSTKSGIDKAGYVSVNAGKESTVKLDILEDNLGKIYKILNEWYNDKDHKKWFQSTVK